MQQRQKMQGKKMKNFNFIKKLGSGSYGTVYQAIQQKTKQVVAIKVISKKTIKSTPKLKQLVASQIKILQQVKNQNVIKFIDSFSSDHSIFIVTQFCNNGDLQQYCQSIGKLPQQQAITFLKQILNGFKGLHDANTMHRDFKLANVLLHNKICKIADLGFAKQLKGELLTGTILGTDQTMAPEVHQGKKYGWGADIWSLGVVFYQMLYGKTPYKGNNQHALLRNIKAGKIDFSGMQISQQAIDFIKKCLTIDPKQRISWKLIYEHQLINKSTLILNPMLLRSNINLQGFKDYYQKNQQQKKLTIRQTQLKLIQQPSKQQQKQTQQLFTNAGKINQADTSAMQQIIKKKQQIDTKLTSYQQQILMQRNKKMYGITLIISQQRKLQSIKNIRHDYALYHICKDAYIQMKKFRFDVQSDHFSFDNKPYQYWKEFKKQTIFKTIIDQLKQDQTQAQSLSVAYLESLTQEEKKLENCNRPTQNKKYKEILDKYYKDLQLEIQKQDGKKKAVLNKMLKAVDQLAKKF